MISNVFFLILLLNVVIKNYSLQTWGVGELSLKTNILQEGSF